MKDHLGNVRALVSDKKVPTLVDGVGAFTGFDPDVLSFSSYYPFGMEIAGHSAVKQGEDGYRYGFNGKEKDPSGEWGSQSVYDYGFRIYNPGIAKFLSVDPLTGCYPMLTPYQFASNRPIDGIDLDGLEYATYTITTLNGHFQSIELTTDYELKNEGTRGAGFQINYVHHYTGDFELRNNNVSAEKWLRERHDPSYSSRIVRTDRKTIFGKNFHGLYVGPFNPELPEGITMRGKHTNYDLAPIDILDAAAKQHDKDYDKVDAAGFDGAMFDINAVPADIALVQRANAIIEMYQKGNQEDPYTKKEISEETYNAAVVVRNLFVGLIMNKIIDESMDRQKEVHKEMDKLKYD
ncbi:MAG: hypothetical protein OEW75_13260 [Cyclobacteriaceae bacterium]|nr:hypothetical protein [Cyclobacteriaceae bacterium]